MSAGITLRLTAVPVVGAPILVPDVKDTTDFSGYATPGPFLVPVPGYADIEYTSRVAASLNAGSIKALVDAGDLTFEFLFTEDFRAALLRENISATVIANYTSAAFERVLVNPSGGTFTVSAPASPVTGDRFGVRNVTSNTTALTLSGNGKNIENPSDPSKYGATFTFGGPGWGFDWEYDGTNWNVVRAVNESRVLSHVLYVDNTRKTGFVNPSSADGSARYPFARIGHAMTYIGDATSAAGQAEQWTVLVAPGTYDEGPVGFSVPSGRRIHLLAMGGAVRTYDASGFGNANITIQRKLATEFDPTIPPTLYIGGLSNSMALPDRVATPNMDDTAMMWTLEGTLKDTVTGAVTLPLNLYLEGVKLNALMDFHLTGSPMVRTHFRNVRLASTSVTAVEAWQWERVSKFTGGNLVLDKLGQFVDCSFGIDVSANNGLIAETGFRPGFLNCYLTTLGGSAASTYRMDAATLARNVPTIGLGTFEPYEASSLLELDYGLDDAGLNAGPNYLAPGRQAASSVDGWTRQMGRTALLIGARISQKPGINSFNHVYSVLRNGVSVASISINNEGTVASQTFNGVKFVAGDLLTLQHTQATTGAPPAVNILITLIFA